MKKHINPSITYSDEKAKEFDLGVQEHGIDYLIKMNKEVNKIIKQKGLKINNYIKVKEERRNGDKDKE